MSAGGLGEVARAALTEGVEGLSRFTIQLMQPVLPMLSQSAESDRRGARSSSGQPLSNGSSTARACRFTSPATTVRVYTRNLNDVTERVPEIVEVAARVAGTRGSSSTAK